VESAVNADIAGKRLENGRQIIDLGPTDRS
jgi:hypothetical protein